MNIQLSALLFAGVFLGFSSVLARTSKKEQGSKAIGMHLMATGNVVLVMFFGSALTSSWILRSVLLIMYGGVLVDAIVLVKGSKGWRRLGHASRGVSAIGVGLFLSWFWVG